MYFTTNSTPLENADKSRRVYLPLGADWIDFWTGTALKGGQWVKADATIDKIPLFVRQGAIIPMGPVMQYTSEKKDGEWEIRIYPGANGSFTVYEDEGDNYKYEQGSYSTYRLDWNEEQNTLTISDRNGTFLGMPTSRKLRLVKVGKGSGVGIIETTKEQCIEYNGRKLVVKL